MNIYSYWNQLSNEILTDAFTPHTERELNRYFDHIERSLEMGLEDQIYLQVNADWGPR